MCGLPGGKVLFSFLILKPGIFMLARLVRAGTLSHLLTYTIKVSGFIASQIQIVGPKRPKYPIHK